MSRRPKGTPTLDEYVQAGLLAMRAKLKEQTMFGPAGRQVIRRDGERVIYGPNGAAIRIIEKVEGGNQIETDSQQHAVVRPGVVSLKFTKE